MDLVAQFAPLILVIGFICFLMNRIRKKTATTKIVSPKNVEYVESFSGFHGTTEHSPNKEYSVTYADGYLNNKKWINGEIALMQGSALLFKKKLQRPNSCHVSNDGIIICCDWLNEEDEIPSGMVMIFNNTGERIFTKKMTANLGECAISANSKIATFETFGSKTQDSNQIFVVDLEKTTIFKKFPTPYPFNSAEIDTENERIKLKDYRGFVFEIDYEGNQTNRIAYENQVLCEGSVFDKLLIYKDKSNDIKFRDENYLHLLIQALETKAPPSSFERDVIYRKIGEYYEASGDTIKTIENWEKALTINPSVGIKRKFDSLKKSIFKGQKT